eukprot:9169231-Heterocapsa_arctica.AAC.1
MAVRYSSARLASTAQVRRILLAAIEHMQKHDESAFLERMRAVKRHLSKLEELCLLPLWGTEGEV